MTLVLGTLVLFSALHLPSLANAEYLYRCLGQLDAAPDTNGPPEESIDLADMSPQLDIKLAESYFLDIMHTSSTPSVTQNDTGVQTAGDQLVILARIYNTKNNQTIPFLTYGLNLSRMTADSGQHMVKETPIIQNELFEVLPRLEYLRFIIKPFVDNSAVQEETANANTANMTTAPLGYVISGTRDTFFLNSWQPDSAGNVRITSSELLKPGKYHMQISAFAYGIPPICLPDSSKDQIKFDSYFTLSKTDVDSNATTILSNTFFTPSGAGENLMKIRGWIVSPTINTTNQTNSNNELSALSSSTQTPQRIDSSSPQIQAALVSAWTNSDASHYVVASGKHVYALWTANVPGVHPNSTVSRFLFIASNDGGLTFGKTVTLPEIPRGPHYTNIATWQDSVYLAVTVEDGVALVTSHDEGNSFEPVLHIGNETTVQMSDYVGQPRINGTIHYDSTSPVLAAMGNNIYATWLDVSFGVKHVVFAASHDSGTTFANSITLDTRATSNATSLELKASQVDNKEVVTVIEHDVKGKVVGRYVSSDGGKSFNTSLP